MNKKIYVFAVSCALLFLTSIGHSAEYSAMTNDQLAKAVKEGDSEAGVKLAQKYISNKEKEKYKEAFKLLSKPAKQGNPEAQYNLGLIYLEALGQKSNYKKAISFFDKAASAGYADAQFKMGQYYHEDKKAKNYDKSFSYYKKAAEQGHALAQLNTGGMLSAGEGVQQNKIEAIEWYKKAAAQSIASAMFNLGLMYSRGEGIAKSEKEGEKWFEKAANAGHIRSQIILALTARDNKDYDSAIKYLEMAKNSGDKAAIQALAIMSIDGEGMEKNAQKGIDMLAKNFEDGHIYSGRTLGLLYYKGEKIPQDYNKAFEWLKKAADKDDALSTFVVSTMYNSGKGVEEDKQKGNSYLDRLLIIAKYFRNAEAAEILNNSSKYYEIYK